MTALNEYIKLKTEIRRELTHLEVDNNFQYVANPWKEARRYKQGMVVYYADTSTGGTGNLGWFRANQDNGPSSIFDPSKWDSIGANSLTGNVFIKDNEANLNNSSLLEFSDDFIITNNGTSSFIEINPNAVGFWSSSPSDSGTIYYGSNVLIGTIDIIDNTYILSVAGNQIVTGDLNVSGTINNINITDLMGDYSVHNHTLVPDTLDNYESLYPFANGSLADVSINISTLTNGDILAWDNSIKKWINKTCCFLPHSLATHTDVAASVSSAPLNNQVLKYNASTLKWENITLTPNSSFGFTAVPFAHVHDARYWTKSQLLASNGPIINYANIFGAPAADAPIDASYVVIGSNASLTNERILTEGTGILITDSGVNAPVTISVVPKTTHQNIEVAVDNVSIGIRSKINFITPVSGNISFTATDNSIDDVVDVEIDAIPPVTSVNSFTGAVSLGIAEMEDVVITPGLFPGVGVGSPFNPLSNILVYDDDIAKWVNVPASSLIAAISGVFLNDLLDVEIQSTGGLFDKDILYFDEASNLWLNGPVSAVDLYTATELNAGQLNVLYYTKTELNTPSGGGQVDWSNLTSVPSLAPASHSHYLYEIIDVKDYSSLPPDPGDILVWNDTFQYWEPQANIDPSFSTIINNYSVVGTFTGAADQSLTPSPTTPLRFQSDNGIILETDITENIIKIEVDVDNVTLGFNTAGQLIFLGEFGNVNGTTNRISYFDTPTSIADSYLLQDINGILIDDGKKIRGASDLVTLDFGTTGNEYFYLTTDAGAGEEGELDIEPTYASIGYNIYGASLFKSEVKVSPTFAYMYLTTDGDLTSQGVTLQPNLVILKIHDVGLGAECGSIEIRNNRLVDRTTENGSTLVTFISSGNSTGKAGILGSAAVAGKNQIIKTADTLYTTQFGYGTNGTDETIVSFIDPTGTNSILIPDASGTLLLDIDINGTQNRIVKYGASGITESSLFDDGTTIAVDANVVITSVNGLATIDFGTGSSEYLYMTTDGGVGNESWLNLNSTYASLGYYIPGEIGSSRIAFNIDGAINMDGIIDTYQYVMAWQGLSGFSQQVGESGGQISTLYRMTDKLIIMGIIDGVAAEADQGFGEFQIVFNRDADIEGTDLYNNTKKWPVIVGAQVQHIEQGVENSVAIGGEGHYMITDDVAYVTKIGHNEGSLTNQTLIVFESPTGAHTITVPATSGTIAVNAPETIGDISVNIGNIGTGEDTLYQYTIDADQLAIGNDKLFATYGGFMVSSGTATRQLKVKFDGNTIFDSTALLATGSTYWNIDAMLIRVNATTIRYKVVLTATGLPLSSYVSVGELSGLDLSVSNLLILTGEAAGAGAATDDIVAQLSTVQYVHAVS